jgi:hypothetical protein
LNLGDVPRVEELIETVASARPGQITPWLRAQLDRLTARADDLRGDQGSVDAGFRAAENGFRELSALFDLAVALSEHAEWLAGQGQLEKVEAPRIEARQIWERLGASLWLERLDRLPTARSQTA